MTANWIDLDPGAGSTAVCEVAKAWTAAQISDPSNAKETVSRILRDLDDSWEGKSATAFRNRLESFRTRLEDSTLAMETAGKAIIEYGDAVEEIARRAEPLKADHASAEAALNGTFDSVVFDRYTTGGAGSRFRAEQQALADADEAATALKALAAERHEADIVVATALATAASIAWDALDATVDPVTGTRRDATNGQVMNLFEHFRTGDERGAVLTDDDIFVRTLMKSDHIEAVRAQVLDDLRGGESFPKFYDRTISDKVLVLLNDLAINIPSLLVAGSIPNDLLAGQNMPETFLGSYGLETRVGEARPDGGVDVTYVINNDTSIDSFTRIPGTGGAHIPGAYEAMLDANLRGAWATHHQAIIWTETVYP